MNKCDRNRPLSSNAINVLIADEIIPVVSDNWSFILSLSVMQSMMVAWWCWRLSAELKEQQKTHVHNRVVYHRSFYWHFCVLDRYLPWSISLPWDTTSFNSKPSLQGKRHPQTWRLHQSSKLPSNPRLPPQYSTPLLPRLLFQEKHPTDPNSKFKHRLPVRPKPKHHNIWTQLHLPTSNLQLERVNKNSQERSRWILTIQA